MSIGSFIDISEGCLNKSWLVMAMRALGTGVELLSKMIKAKIGNIYALVVIVPKPTIVWINSLKSLTALVYLMTVCSHKRAFKELGKV